MVTSHDSCFILGLLEVLLSQFQIKVDADLLLIKLRKLTPKITRLLQSAKGICQPTIYKTLSCLVVEENDSTIVVLGAMKKLYFSCALLRAHCTIDFTDMFHKTILVILISKSPIHKKSPPTCKLSLKR